MIRVILERLEKRFGAIAAVDGASLELRPGEMTYVLGPPGAGKTTLARLVAGLEMPDDGEIYFGDRLVHTLPPHERGVGMVFEDLGLWPGLTVVENVGYPLKVQKMPRPERRRRVSEVLTAPADRQPGRPPARQPDAATTAADRARAGTGDAAGFPGPRRAAGIARPPAARRVLGRPEADPRRGRRHDPGLHRRPASRRSRWPTAWP